MSVWERAVGSRIQEAVSVQVKRVRHWQNGLEVFSQFQIFRRGLRRRFHIHDVRFASVEFDRFLQARHDHPVAGERSDVAFGEAGRRWTRAQASFRGWPG